LDGATQSNSNDPTASEATSNLTKYKDGNLAYGFGELLGESTLSVSTGKPLPLERAIRL